MGETVYRLPIPRTAFFLPSVDYSVENLQLIGIIAQPTLPVESLGKLIGSLLHLIQQGKLLFGAFVMDLFVQAVQNNIHFHERIITFFVNSVFHGGKEGLFFHVGGRIGFDDVIGYLSQGEDELIEEFGG